jgi:hypothetical protein
MAPPRLGAPTQCKARPQDGRPNATQDTSAILAPQCNARHVRKLAAPTHFRNANARHVRTSASWAPQRNERRVRKMGTQMQRKARLQDGCPNENLICNENIHTREHWAKRRARGWMRTNFGLEVDFLIRPHQGWAPQRNARHIHKMDAQMKHKARLQVGCPNATQGTSAS